MNTKTFCIGLTGGIGSGKTTVANLFAKLGVPVIDADEIAYRLTKPHSIAYRDIVQHFGNAILESDETINRKKLRTIIFENPTEKKWLENLLHPMIRQTMQREIQHVHAPYCICVIPLLAESSGIEFIDRVLVVDTPIDIQISRAKKRDNVTEAEIQKIIDSQAAQYARLKIANDIIVNDHDLAALEKQVNALNVLYAQCRIGRLTS